MNSPLKLVASHEQGLTAQRTEAEREAQRMIDEAHAELAELLQQATADLARELADMRRAAVAERAQVRALIEQGAEEKAAKTRAAASGRIEAAKQAITRLVLPSDQTAQ
jgi:vacuolar-type H+-ATPase subunit H